MSYFDRGPIMDFQTVFRAEQRAALAARNASAFTIITGIVDGMDTPRPWLRYWSQYTLGEKERQRDRRLHRTH